LHEAAERHREILQRVIARQISADVPVTSYLSGGIDSSSICALAFLIDPHMRAYSCIFDLDGVGDDKIVDEREFSRAMARHLSISHVELLLQQDTLAHSLLDTVSAMEDPRMGMSYVNYRIAQRVAQDRKVVLSGTGGDEMHGGYLARYQVVSSGSPPKLFSRAGLKYFVDRFRTSQSKAFHANRILPLLNYPIQEGSVRKAFTPEFLSAAREVPQIAERMNELLAECPSDHAWDMLMYVDARTYLHGLLVLEDKISMAHSLEARVPLLDNELVDFVCTLPWSHFVNSDTGKIVFRESVKPFVPDIIYRKPKMGFGPPDASWYRGKLRPFIEARLSPRRVARRGGFQPSFVASTLDRHFGGVSNEATSIWSLLSFDAWCEVFNQYGGAA